MVFMVRDSYKDIRSVMVFKFRYSLVRLFSWFHSSRNPGSENRLVFNGLFNRHGHEWFSSRIHFFKNILVLIRKGINKVLNCCFKKRKYHLLIKKKRKQEAVIKELNQKIEDFLTSNPKLKRSLEEKVIISQEESLTPPTQKGEEENE